MTMTDTLLIDLDDPAARDTTRCGGKAAALAELRAAGFPTPPGVVLPADAAAGWPAGDPAPEALRREAVAAVDRFGGAPLAVRSSGVAEDLAGASFAGAYVSVLGVEGADAVVAAVSRCLAARHLARVSAYRGGEAPPLAVLIQPMVAPEAAGIAFTADPVTGDRDVVRVSAVPGLGDHLAEGTVEPEEWDVRDGTATRRPESAVTALEAAVAAAVADVARRVAEHFGTPQDVEWALAGGEVLLLQARPITALPTPPAETLPGGGWEKDVAHFPEQVTPFGASLYAGAMDSGVPAMAETFGLMIKAMEIKVIGGEVYARVVPVIGPAEPKGPNPPAWLLGLLARVLPPLRRRAAAAERAVANGLLESIPQRWEAEWRPELQSEIERLLAVDLAGLDDATLIEHSRECLQLMQRGSHIHFQLFVPYLVDLHELVVAGRDLLGWDEAATMRLLASPASVAGRRELTSLRSRLDDRAVAALRARPADPVAALAEVGPDLAGELADWLTTHGWRTANYDPGSPALAERPGLVTRLLLAAEDVPESDAAAQAEAEARARLDGHDLARFEGLLARARRTYPQREDNVILTDNVPCGLLRRWLIEAGHRLVDRGVLPRADDAAYLDIDEIIAALRSEPETDPAAAAARRRGEWAWTRAHPGPKHVGATAPPPDVSKLPGAFGRINGALLWAIGHEFPEPAAAPDGAGLVGVAASPGSYTGPARIIHGETEFSKLLPGDVLVCPVTTPAWSPLFSLAGAVVSDGGGVLSHAAIVAREHGLPAVLGTHTATRSLRDGQLVTVDGGAGTVAPTG